MLWCRRGCAWKGSGKEGLPFALLQTTEPIIRCRQGSVSYVKDTLDEQCAGAATTLLQGYIKVSAQSSEAEKGGQLREQPAMDGAYSQKCETGGQ